MKKSFLKQYLSSSDNRDEAGISESFSNYLFGLQRASIVMENFKTEEDRTQELINFVFVSDDIKSDIIHTKRKLFKHWEKNSYSPGLAVKLWNKVARNAARKYSNEILGEPRLVGNIFNDDVTELAAEQMEQKFRKDLENNDVDMEELFQ